MSNFRNLLVVCAISCSQIAFSAEYQHRVGVQKPTRLDWSFSVAKKSLAEPPPEWVRHVYESNKQTYEFFGPGQREKIDLRQPLPLILFVSPKGKAIGWKHFEPVCRELGFLYAGPNGTFKGTSDSLRIRVVMDVLDDVRSRFPIDPDRTYIVGFYGGARVASRIAYHLPEYFGGVISIAGGVEPPNEFWIRQPMIDRTSIVHLVAAKDRMGVGNQRHGMTRLFHQKAADADIRSELAIYGGTVEKMPNAALLANAIRWLEEDLPRRRDLAKRFPSTSIAEQTSRSDHASAELRDAKNRFENESERYAAWLMLEAIQNRWPDLAEATEAKSLASEFRKQPGDWQERVAEDKLRKAELQENPSSTKATAAKPGDLIPLRRLFGMRHVDAQVESSNTPTNYDADTLKRIKQLGGRVTLNANGHVNYVDLSGTRVTGAQLANLKRQLKGMTELRAIDLSRTVMRESTLNHLADLENLQCLDLSGSQVTDRGLGHLTGLKHLRFLSLTSTNCNTKGVQKITGPSLKYLDLGGTNVEEGILEHLRDATELTGLSLAATRISKGAWRDADFASLQYLDLSSTKVNDLTCDHLAQIKSLRQLVLNHTSVTNKGLESINKLPNLVELHLVGTAIDDDGLGQLRCQSLTSVDVRDTKVTTAGVLKLNKMYPNMSITNDD